MNIDYTFINYTFAQAEKANEAFKLLEGVLVKKEFDDLILSKKYEETKDTPEQILAKIKVPIKVNLRAYSTWWFSKVVGYYENGTCYTVGKRILSMQLEDLAAHYAHEILGHGNGYTHYSNNSSISDKTVPYQIQHVVEEMLG